MTAIAIADSPLARALIAEGTLEVDYLEVHGPHVASARARFPSEPMLLHNSLYDWSLAHPDALNHKRARELTIQCLAQTRAPWLSVHCGFSAAQVAFRERSMHALTPALDPEPLFEQLCATILQLRALIDVPLLLENLDYCPTDAYESICRPEFLAAVLQATDCGLLLDLAHAQVSAAAFGMSIQDYLAALPLQRVRQLHISGPRWEAGQLVDVHEVLRDEDYALLAEVLAQTEPWVLTLEYTGSAPELLEQLRQLSSIVSSSPARSA